MNWREGAARAIQQLSKKDRPEALSAMRKTGEYWDARVARLLEKGEKAVFSPDRTSLRWKKKHLYHGTDIEGISEFTYAEESTIGDEAVYFSTDPKLGIGYAKLRGKERTSGKSFLYEATVEDVQLMNWAENMAVDILKKEFSEYCKQLIQELDATGYESFKQRFDLRVSENVVRYAFKEIFKKVEGNDLTGGNIKTIAQGVMGTFFQAFVTDKGFDGVITIEGGDDTEHTAEPGISVVLYTKEKITSHKAVNVGD